MEGDQRLRDRKFVDYVGCIGQPSVAAEETTYVTGAEVYKDTV
jgi:hypothetical protein